LSDGEIAALTADAHAFAGTGAIASLKNRKGCRVHGTTWSWQAPDGTFTLTYSILLRVLCVLFLEIPAAIVPDDPILKNTLERLSAYCLRACIALPSMRSFHAARHIFWLGSHSRLIRHYSQQLSLTSLLGAPLFRSPFLILPGL
jgi:hypothetical protein